MSASFLKVGAFVRILVVDDSLMPRKFVKEALEKNDYSVVTTDSGVEALDIIQKSEPFDLVILDVIMEGLDGFETCLLMRQLDDPNKSEVPVIFMTGRDTFEGRRRGFSIGAADFIAKKDLQAVIHQAVDRLLKPDQVMECRALVMDGQKVSRMMMVRALGEIFSHVDHVESGAAGIELMKEQRVPYDVYVLEQDMPGRSGTELTKVIRRELGIRDAPIILINGEKDREKVVDFFAHGGTDCLQKPYLKEELHARIKVQLENMSLRRMQEVNIARLTSALEAKDKFLAACSHDIKTPLNAILGFADLLKEDCANQPHVVADLDRIFQAGLILQGLVQNIIELYRVQSEGQEVVLEPLDITEILGESYAINSQLAHRKGIAFSFDPEVIPLVKGNRIALLRVVNNLVSNALKFTDRGGVVKMTVVLKDQRVAVSVSDSGTGMDQEVMSHLFREFSKSSRSGTAGESGTGLGLMITKQLVEQNGGQITVESTPGEGSTFTFDLKTA